MQLRVYNVSHFVRFFLHQNPPFALKAISQSSKKIENIVVYQKKRKITLYHHVKADTLNIFIHVVTRICIFVA